MGKIIAIGGGEIGGPRESGGNYPIETANIDKEIISLAKKNKPKLLFIPTASSDSEDYSEHAKKYFSKLGCQVNTLYLINQKHTQNELEQIILSTDIIYVGGGNTLKMMMIWRRLGIDKILKKAYEQNIVLSGISAGSICWFSYGNSDSRIFTSNSKQLIKVTGLSLINALLCPHYGSEINRQKELKRMMKSTPRIVALAVDDCCAIEIIDSKFRIIKSKPNAKAYKMCWKNGKYFKNEIISNDEFEDLDELLTK